MLRKWEINEIIPIPLHSSRKRMRGYNQAEILASELSFLTGILSEKMFSSGSGRRSPRNSWMTGREDRISEVRLLWPRAGIRAEMLC